MNTTSKLVVIGILVILVVALGTYGIIQANALLKPYNQEEQIKHCNEIKASMAPDELANSAQWKNMHCESLLK
ncbi:MAG: hypothetical protein WA364_24425 [Candidatus Nitrosopolaris sp.]|jgi:hypothetical protein